MLPAHERVEVLSGLLSAPAPAPLFLEIRGRLLAAVHSAGSGQVDPPLLERLWAYAPEVADHLSSSETPRVATRVLVETLS